MSKTLWAAIAIAIVVIGGLRAYEVYVAGPKRGGRAQAAIKVDVRVPKLDQVAALGEKDFNENCVACHGRNAGGSDDGPPLVHPYYRPGHHGDIAFSRAARYGVKAHHWAFGNMPPQPQVTQQQINRIVAYIRALQRENGIN